MPRKKEYISDYRTLTVYQRALAFEIAIYDMAERLPVIEKFNICDQLHRASSSVPSNIAEGHSSFFYKKEFDRLDTSLGSIAEVRCFLDQAKLLKYINDDLYSQLDQEAEQILKMLIGMMKRIQNFVSEEETD